jgi:hypothetical protein
MTIEDIKTELREIIELSGKATPAPWVLSPPQKGELPCYGGRFLGELAFAAANTKTASSERNAALITASRNLTPKTAKALLGVIESLERYAIPTSDAQAQLETIRREWEVQA